MTNRAVVIGVADYIPSEGPVSHREIANSARQYAKFLRTDPRWQDGEGHIELLVTRPREGGSDHETEHEADVRRPETFTDVMSAIEDAANAANGKSDTLLIVYVGHGACFDGTTGPDVYFAVGTTRSRKEYTWLPTWYIYREIRNSRAGLKILIADSCYSNFLNNLARDNALPGPMSEYASGSLVLTASGGEQDTVYASGCGNLGDEELGSCTPFSAHLLRILKHGIAESSDKLTIGMIKDALDREMTLYGCRHPRPRIITNTLSHRDPLFANNISPDAARNALHNAPETSEDWIRVIKRETAPDLTALFVDPEKTARVTARLYQDDPPLAAGVDKKARSYLKEDQKVLSQYWRKLTVVSQELSQDSRKQTQARAV